MAALESDTAALKERSASTAAMVFLSILPVILIVTCSMLLDLALRREAATINLRCQCQVWMWLAVAMSWMQDNTSIVSLDPGGDIAMEHDTMEALFFVWVHATLSFNLLAVLAERIPSLNTILRGHSANFPQSILSFTKVSVAVQTLQLLSISSWSTVLFSAFRLCNPPSDTMTGTTHPGMVSIECFVITLLVLLLTRWHIHRQQKVVHGWEGNPTIQATTTTTTINAASEPVFGRFFGPVGCIPAYHGTNLVSTTIDLCDETLWYTWDREQTLQWISYQLDKTDRASNASLTNARASSHNEAKDEKRMVLSKLANQQISGDVLDELVDVSKLLLLQIPFGPACRLSRTIARLTNQHPNPNRTLSRNGDANADTGNEVSWLSEHDKEYNSSSGKISREHSKGNTEGIEAPFQRDISRIGKRSDEGYVQRGIPSPSESEELNRLMKEKFGLELPRVHHDRSTKCPSDGGHDIPYRVGHSVPSSQPANHPNSSPNGDDTTSNPLHSVQPDLISQMPPHIQDIARRRPDLIKQLIVQKQRLPKQSVPLKNAVGMTHQSQTFTQGHHPPPTDAPFLSCIREAEYDDQDLDGNDDDETTSLISNDQNLDSEVRYRSIDKTK